MNAIRRFFAFLGRPTVHVSIRLEQDGSVELWTFHPRAAYWRKRYVISPERRWESIYLTPDDFNDLALQRIGPIIDRQLERDAYYEGNPGVIGLPRSRIMS